MTLSNQQQKKQQRNQLERLAEHHSPSRYATLKHFLDVSLRHGADPADIAAAAERDPVILAAFLRLHDKTIDSIERWYEGIDPALFPAFALSMAGNFLRQGQHHDEKGPGIDYWNRSILHSLLAEELAAQINKNIVARARLAGLLAGIGLMLPTETRNPQSADVVFSSTPEQDLVAQHSADLLRSWGCTSAFCDAIRYQHAPLESLADTSPLIKITAIAGIMAGYAEEPESLPDDVIELASRFGFNGKNLSEGIRFALLKLDKILPVDPDVSAEGDRLRRTVDDAGLAAIFQNALAGAGPDSIDKVTRDSGKFLFSFDRVIRIKPHGTFLEASVTDDETIRIPADSEESLVAACYRDSQVRTILPENPACIQDNQLLDRVGSEVLLCLPLNGNGGILACGIDRHAMELTEQNPHLLNWYKNLFISPPGNSSKQDNPASEGAIDEHIKRRIDKLIHEVNNPYSIVQNYLHTLSVKLGKDSPLQKDIETISVEISRSAEILRSFADMGGHEEPVPADTNVNEILEELIGVFKGSNRNIRFNASLDDTVAPVSLNPDDLKQILVNIIKNAVECFEDYKQYGNKSKITLGSTGSVNVNGNQYLELTISDNGPGIPDEIQTRLFQPNLTTKGPEHSGLGLSIVRELVEKMNGMITCKTRDSNGSVPGTTFTVYIPKDNTSIPNRE